MVKNIFTISFSVFVFKRNARLSSNVVPNFIRMTKFMIIGLVTGRAYDTYNTAIKESISRITVSWSDWCFHFSPFRGLQLAIFTTVV